MSRDHVFTITGQSQVGHLPVSGEAHCSGYRQKKERSKLMQANVTIQLLMDEAHFTVDITPKTHTHSYI